MRLSTPKPIGVPANFLLRRIGNEESRPELDWIELAQGLGVDAVRAATGNEFIRELRERGPRLIEAVFDGA